MLKHDVSLQKPFDLYSVQNGKG
jgi:hypothetical protein